MSKLTYDQIVDYTETAVAVCFDADDLCRKLAQEIDNREHLAIVRAIQVKIDRIRQIHRQQRAALYQYPPAKQKA